MYSYDHDLASFVAIGTGTVSADGSVIASDPGVGVLKAGWHCGGDPNANGTVADCPDCRICTGNACVADPAREGTACQTNRICRGGNCVCAVVANFQQTGTSDAGNGVLHFDYTWGSSTGNLADLSACTLSELVEYTPADLPAKVPFPASFNPPNPTILSVPAVNGAAQDNHSIGAPFRKPYANATMTAVQRYRYTCPCANGGNPVVIVGPINIVRSVSDNGNGTFRYTITKSGSSAVINPLP
jgi:hypothetical protein